MSPAALARLAGALRLGRAERAYLFELAGKRDPEQGAEEADALPAVMQRCVEAISSPAYILDRSWNARSWNRPAERLLPAGSIGHKTMAAATCSASSSSSLRRAR